MDNTEVAKDFSGFRGFDERLALKYATAAALKIPEEVLALDAADLLEGQNLDTPYWRTKRFGHAEVRDQSLSDGLSLVECVVMQGSVRRLLGDRRFIERVRQQQGDVS